MNETPRQKRIKEFRKFTEEANRIFLEFKGKEINTFFEDYYMLCIVPGGRNGGIDDNLFEVFYGARPVGKTTRYVDERRVVDTILERGVTLRYQLFDNGYYSITFYPALTENQRPIEDFIYFKFSKKTNKLLQKRELKKHWKYFIAYMHLTSLDGAPNIWQRLRVFKMRYFHHLVIEQKVTPIRFIKQAKTILNYALTVGLSGGLLSLITMWRSDSPDDINRIKEDINKLKVEYTLQNKVNCSEYNPKMLEFESEIEALQNKCDSLSSELFDNSQIDLEMNVVKIRIQYLESLIKKQSKLEL